jgi:hypothetical protein
MNRIDPGERPVFDIYDNPDITQQKISNIFRGIMQVMSEQFPGIAIEAEQSAYLLSAACIAAVGTSARLPATHRGAQEACEIFYYGFKHASAAIIPNPEQIKEDQTGDQRT